mgnify:CR=1 FL=1
MAHNIYELNSNFNNMLAYVCKHERKLYKRTVFFYERILHLGSLKHTFWDNVSWDEDKPQHRVLIHPTIVNKCLGSFKFRKRTCKFRRISQQNGWRNWQPETSRLAIRDLTKPSFHTQREILFINFAISFIIKTKIRYRLKLTCFFVSFQSFRGLWLQ